MVSCIFTFRRAWAAPGLALLLTAASLAFAPPAQAAPSCGDDFNDSGAPDDANCMFSCTKGQQISIGIYASDADATVSGSARCGGGWSPCRANGGTNSCGGSEGVAATDDSGGSCSANVNEMWNSAWSYHCASRDVGGEQPCTTDCPPPPPPPGNCIIGQIVCCPTAICPTSVKCDGSLSQKVPDVGDPDPHALVDSQPGALCETVEPLLQPLSTSADPRTGLPAGVTSRVDVWVAGDAATARLCNAGIGCWSVAPVCTFDVAAGRAACVVPADAVVLGPAQPFAA